jgi:methionine aminopeptidase
MIAELPQVMVVTPLGRESQGVFVSGKGVSRMLLLSRYKRKELPHRLIRIHESLVEDMIAYFEKGKITREKMKEAGKAVKQALKLAKKKKINPGVKINQAREVLEKLREEVQYTRKVVRATAEEMEKAIRHIEEERIGEVQALIDLARERFRNKEIEKGLDVLKEAQGKMTKKVLDKTRQAVLAGIHSEVKNLKYELEERRRKKASK